jgi:hypothetical protein
MDHSITRPRSAHDVGESWTVADAADLYEVSRWGNGYFAISENGHLMIHPTKEPNRAIDLKQLVDDLQLRSIGLPLLIRFRDVLQHRLREIAEAFQSAITQHEYSGRYLCVYPIKVNQQRQVVEEVINFGRQYGFGLTRDRRGQPQIHRDTACGPEDVDHRIESVSVAVQIAAEGGFAHHNGGHRGFHLPGRGDGVGRTDDKE